jgi:myo-inositol-1(or 4)-monophosphatase
MREIELIEQMLAEASDVVMRYHRDRDAMDIAVKTDPLDVVTRADIEAQQIIVGRIAEHFPDDTIVGEEEGYDRPPEDPEARCWVIDPIDGTHNFTRALVPSWGVSICFAVAGRPRAAGIAAPALGNTFLAEAGAGATHNGRPVRVSDIAALDHAKISIDFTRPQKRAAAIEMFDTILRTAGQIRATGSTVVALCDVANGTADAYLHAAISPWDYAAGVLIIEEAGGKITRSNGDPIHLFDGREEIIASNTHLHDELLAQLG